MTTLRAENVSFSYSAGRRGIDSITAEFRPGELVAVAGPNGSGKSTLLKVMTRILEPESGRIVFHEKPVGQWDRRDYAKRVGYLPQDPDPAFPMRAIDVVLTGRGPYLGRFEWETERDLELARRALALCDGLELQDRGLDEMSGGERKRIFLARALAGDPEVIFLDEPLAALDLAHVQRFLTSLRSIVDSMKKSVVFVSHDLNWSAAFADRMIIMNGGRIVLDGSPETIMRPGVMREHFDFDARSIEAQGIRWIVPAIHR